MQLQRYGPNSPTAEDGDLSTFNPRTLKEDEMRETLVPKARRKSFGFMMAFLALAIVAFVSTLDATTLSVALPVRKLISGKLLLECLNTY